MPLLCAEHLESRNTATRYTLDALSSKLEETPSGPSSGMERSAGILMLTRTYCLVRILCLLSVILPTSSRIQTLTRALFDHELNQTTLGKHLPILARPFILLDLTFLP
jgi:hypothetical protein